MSRQKIDIHNSHQRYAHAKEQLKKDKQFSQRNKEFLLSFLRDAELGKTVLKKQKKRINSRTCLKYSHLLKICAYFLNKDFDTVTQEDMEQFIYALENGTIKKKNSKEYSAETKRDIKVALKKFYKWLLGNNETYPSIVKWFDTATEQKYSYALTEQQIQEIIIASQTQLEKAVISVLFDLGVRIEEFLNIQKEDVIQSSTVWKIQIQFSKTFSRTLPLDRSTVHLKVLLENHTENEKRLFPCTYTQCLSLLKKIGKRTVGIAVTPHMIRHSKATQLAQAGVGRYQMCEWMGWAMSSKMPDRYIRREGIDNQKTLEEIKRKRE